MKFTISVFFALTICLATAFGQSPADKLRSAVENNDYQEAANYIEEATKNNKRNSSVWELAGDVYHELRELDLAVDMYDQALDINDDNTVAMRKLGLVYSELGRYKDAFKILEKAREKDNNDIENHLALAQAYINADSITKAEIVITQARELDKDNPAAFVALGDLYFASRVYELARQNYEEALGINEELIEARIKLAKTYYWLANREMDKDLANEYFSRSLKEWNVITKKAPKNAQAYLEQGKILFYAKKYGQAAGSLSEYVAMRPSASLARWFLAQSFLKIGECDSAKPHLDIVGQEIDSVKNQTDLLLGRCYIGKNEYGKAIEALKQARKDTVLLSKDIKDLGIAYFNTGDTTNALNEYRRAIELDPDGNCNLIWILGTQYSKMKRYDEGIDMLKLRLDTEECRDELDPKVYYTIGQSYYFSSDDTLFTDEQKQSRLDSAISNLKKAVELDSTYLWAHVYLGDVYAAKENYEKAEESFNYVLAKGDTTEAKNQLIQTFYKLAGIKLDNKQWNDLVQVGNKWSDTFPESEYAYLFTAFGYQGQGPEKYPQACTAYKKVLDINPKNSNARQNINALQCNAQGKK
ncbi:MAG: tetratricopeptide repeat protein [Candidatus Kapaibacterium sp.]